MPQINLLSPVSTARKRDREQKAVASIKISSPKLSGIIHFPDNAVRNISICAGVLFVIWLFLFINVKVKQGALAKLEKEVTALAADPKEMENLRNERAALEQKVKLIDSLSSRKFFWFEKLAYLADLIPGGIWLTDASSRQERITPSSDPASFEETTVFVIKGTAVAYKIDDAVTLIGEFIKNLQNSENFAKDFKEIKLNNIAKGTIGGLDVMQFDLMCVAK